MEGEEEKSTLLSINLSLCSLPLSHSLLSLLTLCHFLPLIIDVTAVPYAAAPGNGAGAGAKAAAFLPPSPLAHPARSPGRAYEMECGFGQARRVSPLHNRKYCILHCVRLEKRIPVWCAFFGEADAQFLTLSIKLAFILDYANLSPNQC